jgi:dTDP-4-amino-4,6-dideoxygalactose transaminase
MITTRHADWDRRFRLLRQHGMSVQPHDRHRADQVVFEQYLEPGFNFRMSDLQAAVGRAQLARLDEIVRRRRALAARYATQLAGISGIVLPQDPPWARSNWQSYAVRLQPPLEQRAVMQQLLAAGVGSHRGVMCCHREPACPPGSWRSASGLGESERATDTAIMLPLFPSMSEDEQDRVVEALRAIARA